MAALDAVDTLGAAIVCFEPESAAGGAVWGVAAEAAKECGQLVTDQGELGVIVAIGKDL